MDIRTLSRRFGAFCLFAGPVTVATGTLLQSSSGTTADQLQWTAAHLAEARIGSLIGLGTLFIVPAMLYLMRLARRRSPKLAVAGGAISFAAWLAGIASVASVSTVAVYAAQQPDRAAAVTLMDKLSGDPAMGVLTAVFVLGHLIGLLLLGIALYRSRAVPRWAAVLVGISPILHAAGMVLSAAADAGTFYLMTIGMLGCAWALLRVPDEDWDLAPAGPGAQPVQSELPGQPVSA